MARGSSCEPELAFAYEAGCGKVVESPGSDVVDRAFTIFHKWTALAENAGVCKRREFVKCLHVGKKRRKSDGFILYLTLWTEYSLYS